MLRWAVQGCLMYQKAGLTLPQKVVMDQAAYRESQDVLAQWIDQCCEGARGSKTRSRIYGFLGKFLQNVPGTEIS